MRILFCKTPREFVYEQQQEPIAAPGETLLLIERVGICGTDLHAFEGTQPFFSYPRILGHELAASIIHTDAPGFVNGEKVTFVPYFSCDNCVACKAGKPNCCTTLRVCGVHIDGGMREFMVVPSKSLVHGEGLTVDELALVEPLAIGAHAVKRAAISPDEFVLVIGAGPIGLGTMEFARIAGAKVIAMDVNSQRLSFCREKLHVAHTVNPSEVDALEILVNITGKQMPTVVMDATGNLPAINNAFRFVAHGGRYILVGLQKGDISFSHPEFHKRELTLMSSRNATREDFEHVIDSIKRKAVNPATYITHRVAFEEVKDNFESWLNPASGVIKAIVEMK